jgi:3-oxoacyl-[acyl-carrier protein] reductase
MIETGLKDKVVIVTGAAAGIGRATALRFAEEGCRVAAWDVNDSVADEVISELEAAGGSGSFQRVNVAEAEEVEAAVAEIVERWGGIDVLVNNAGILRDAQLVKYKDGQVASTMSDEQWDAVIGVNLRGVFNCTRAAVPHMIARGGGVVLNASSVAGRDGNFGQTNYVAAKAGLIGMTKTWSRELARYKIRVNAVAPGFVKTEILASMPDKILDAMVAHTPLGRIGEPRDIADAYLWLASDAASWITGITLSVDGGLVIGT